MKATVLRLGHRKSRDKRVTTHVFLAARALGACGGILTGEQDDVILDTVRKVADKWGGEFSISFSANWKRDVSKAKKSGLSVVHLTMYGEPVQARIAELRRKKALLVVVGAQKVPAEAYSLADYNIAVTGQPHSEVAALAVFLHELAGGKELGAKFSGARISVKPNPRGKTVIARVGGKKARGKTHLYM